MIDTLARQKNTAPLRSTPHWLLLWSVPRLHCPLLSGHARQRGRIPERLQRVRCSALNTLTVVPQRPNRFHHMEVGQNYISRSQGVRRVGDGVALPRHFPAEPAVLIRLLASASAVPKWLHFDVVSFVCWAWPISEHAAFLCIVVLDCRGQSRSPGHHHS